MAQNIYGGISYPNTSFVFDKIYNSYADAVAGCKEGDSVLVSRYILIQYHPTIAYTFDDQIKIINNPLVTGDEKIWRDNFKKDNPNIDNPNIEETTKNYDTVVCQKQYNAKKNIIEYIPIAHLGTSYSTEYVDNRIGDLGINESTQQKITVKTYIDNIQQELLNTDKLDSKLSVSAVSLDCNNIIVKSSQEIIDKIGVVKALIDASQITLTDSGDYTLENVKLVAYDQEGAILENVEMVPSKVNATVTVDSYHATKPVKIITTGSFSNGYAISSIESSVKEVVVYGEKSVVDALTNVEATVDLSSFDSNKENTIETTLDLNKPTGVREMSATKTKVKIKVESSVDKQVDGVSIHTIGLGNGYTVNAVSDGDKAISVIVKGVSSVVKEYDSSKVYAYVDLTGLKPGTHTLPVFITVEDERVTIKPLVDKISVKIK